MKAVDWSLYVITDRRAAGPRSLLDVVWAAIQGGATVVQLREKEASTREMIRLGQSLHELTQRAGVPLIVNDRVDVALAIDAEGVHLGVDDMPVSIARRLLGPHRLIGFSPSTIGEAHQAEREGADYLGVGDVYGTPSKPDAGPPIGIEGLSRFVQTVSIPVVARRHQCQQRRSRDPGWRGGDRRDLGRDRRSRSTRSRSAITGYRDRAEG